MIYFFRAIRKLLNAAFFLRYGLQKGKHVDIRHRVYFDYPNKVKIGDNTLINSGCSFFIGGGKKTILIGKNVQIGMNCTFSCVSHEIGIEEQRAGTHVYKNIVVEDGVWVGAGSTILLGVTIAKGCVIAAGSVVIRSTEPNGLYAGVPAKRIKNL